MVDGEIIYNQLISLWEEAEGYTKEDAIEVILSVAKDIQTHGKKLGGDTIRYIQKLRIENQECPLCSAKLETKTETYLLSEAWGRNIYDDDVVSYCPDCNWSDRHE